MGAERAYEYLDDGKTIAEIQKEHGEIVAIMGWDSKKSDSFILINRRSAQKGRLSKLPEGRIGDFGDGLMRISYIYLNKLLNT